MRPQVLQRLLPDQVEVINAAVIGYSSEQARAALVREFYKYRPNGILIYLGNNEGFGSTVSDRRLGRHQYTQQGSNLQPSVPKTDALSN